MGESLLKKEFKSKDVERVRNLVKKDFSAKTTTGVGYEKQYEIHSEVIYGRKMNVPGQSRMVSNRT